MNANHVFKVIPLSCMQLVFFITVGSVRHSRHLHAFANKHQFQLQSYAKLVHSRRSFLWNHQYTKRKRRIVAWLKAECCQLFRLKTNLLTHVWWACVVLLPTHASKLSELLKKTELHFTMETVCITFDILAKNYFIRKLLPTCTTSKIN